MVNLSPEFISAYKANKDSWRWRIANLYTVKPREGGQPMWFVPNPIQARFYEDMWRRNVVLKARGIGMSTAIMVFLLDKCYTVPNFSCALCAHTEDKAIEIFRDLILFPHENCEYPVKKELKPGTYGAKSELQFENGSTIAVYVTMAGGSHQAIVSTELGVLSATNPEAAKTFKMQGLPTIRDENGFVFIESTGQGGPQGVFYDTCLAAREETNMILAGTIKGNQASYRFHFFPWFDDPRNTRKTQYPIPKEDAEYFAKLDRELKITLTDNQKWWYCEKANGPTGLAKIGEMHSQYPSTFDEAFESFVQDAYMTQALNKASQEGRIGTFKYNPGYPIQTWWDLGLDCTAIWFTQTIGNMINVIWYYENTGFDLLHYTDYLSGAIVKLPWNKARYGQHVGPHDTNRGSIGNDAKRNLFSIARNMGYTWIKTERPIRKQHSIQAAMMFASRCNFDKENCALGLRRLENYRPQWDKKLDIAKANPLHDMNSHGGSAFETLALYHDKVIEASSGFRPARTGNAGMQQSGSLI